jgi:hypothetical protein
MTASTRTLTAIAMIAIATGGTACGNSHAEGIAPDDRLDQQEAPMIKLAPIGRDALCVTKGAARVGERVTRPTMRAFAHETSGDAAALTFVYRGETEHARALASGQERRQLGLKLRAANGCNLVYVMWRQGPKPKLDISLKYNPAGQARGRPTARHRRHPFPARRDRGRPAHRVDRRSAILARHPPRAGARALGPRRPALR